jgi:hypothetical protein
VLESIPGEVSAGASRRPHYKLVDSWWGEPIPEDERDEEDPQEYAGQDDEDWPEVAKVSFGVSIQGIYQDLWDHNSWHIMAKELDKIHGDPSAG